MPAPLQESLFELLRIPSISSGGGNPTDLERAAQWLADFVLSSGGEAGLVPTKGHPLVIGELKASRPDAPTVIIYGHYDVQSPDPIESWTSDPFEPEIRDGRIYARGSSDDKGNYFPLLWVACDLFEKGELPVNVRVFVEGEEEVGGSTAVDWVKADERGAEAAIVFDSDMLNATTPAITLGVRGIVSLKVKVKTGDHDLHSGLYGGAALNAVNVLHAMLAHVAPDAEGKVRDELREGIAPPAPEELAAWEKLSHGDDVIAEVGGRPIAPHSGSTYYPKTWADASVDINGFLGGDAIQRRTIVPIEAAAVVSIRLAPGQSASKTVGKMQDLLMKGAPKGADVTFEPVFGEPALFDPSLPAIQLGAEAIGKACGSPPVFVRSGGSIPVLAGFAARGIPTILSGFALSDDRIHAPDESYRVESLELGTRASQELYAALARLRG